MQQAATKRILLLMFTVMLLIAVAIATILPNRAVAKQTTDSTLNIISETPNPQTTEKPISPNTLRGRPGIPTARNVDHMGITVPDINQALRFFVDVLGADVLWVESEGTGTQTPLDMQGIFNVDPRSSITLSLLRFGPNINVELMEYKAPDQNRRIPKNSDVDVPHIAFFVDDVNAAAAYLHSKALNRKKIVKRFHMTEQIGFIGLGNMGLPMANNLMEAGYMLHVYNRTPEKADPLVKRGATLVSHPKEVAQPGGIVISMLPNDQAVRDIVSDETGMLERLGSGGIHVSMSTIAPVTASQLAEHHQQHGVTYLAAPVLGAPDVAAARKLWMYLSGPQMAKERVRPLLEVLGQGVFDFGEEPGAANVVKLASNFLLGAALEAMAEAFTFAEKNGIEREKIALCGKPYDFCLSCL